MIALCLAALLSQTPAAAGDGPLIPLEQAIVKAKDHAKAKKVDLSRQYLEAAEFDRNGAAPKKTGRCWKLRWQVPHAKGGTTFIDVCEDGRIDVSFGE